MTFKKGDPKPPNSGIKKGDKHKRSVLKVEELLLDRNIHPIDKILEQIPHLTPADQVKTWLLIMKYVEPELKPVDVLLNITPQPAEQNLLDAQTTEQLLEAYKRSNSESLLDEG